MDTDHQQDERSAPSPWDIGFGAVFLAAALLALFVWFPLDIPTGFFFVNAIGREEPGDAFFPIILAALLAGLSVIQIAAALRGSKVRPGVITKRNLAFLGVFVVIVGIGMAMMYGLGPLTVWVLNALGALEGSYRNFSDTAPYKYIGYVFGGGTMTLALIFWAEGRARPAAILTVLIVLVVSVVLFDVALKNVLLPPNADL